MPTAIAAIALSVAAGGVEIAGQLSAANARSKAANYNAQIQERNSEVALQNSRLSGEAGNVQLDQQGLKSKAISGEIKVNEGASGVDVGSESFSDVRESQRELSQSDAINIRANATKEAYGYQVQSQGYTAQSSLDKAEAANAITAGNYQAAGTLLGTASQSTSEWANFKLAGAFG